MFENRCLSKKNVTIPKLLYEVNNARTHLSKHEAVYKSRIQCEKHKE